MTFQDKFRDPRAVSRLCEALHRITRHPWRIMEICGGQTHAFLQYGIEALLPEAITLLHGPGCPVCVTPLEKIEQALTLAQDPSVLFCTFGDMLRVPGKSQDLLSIKASGGDVRMVYSPLDAVKIARENPKKEVVFFAIGFETTVPTTAGAVLTAEAEGITNFSLLVAHVRVPPAIEALLKDRGNRIQGFLAAGHVCTVMGYEEYEPIAESYKTPIVVTGFEPVDLLIGLYRCVSQLEEGRHEVENAYGRSVRRQGNPVAREAMGRIFEIADQTWRGIGPIPGGGYRLREPYRHFDAAWKFGLADGKIHEPPICHAGEVLRGRLRPTACPAFGQSCTPESPLGAPMVSSEGACAAYFRYRGSHG